MNPLSEKNYLIYLTFNKLKNFTLLKTCLKGCYINHLTMGFGQLNDSEIRV